MSDLIHGHFHPHSLLAALAYAQKHKTNDALEVIKENEKKKITPLLKETLATTSTVPPRQTPRLSLAQVKKAAAYPSAAAARSSLRRPSVTSAPEISQTTEDTSPTADVPPALIRQPEILPRV